jgi:serine beta-lactamase-like protein LACTB
MTRPQHLYGLLLRAPVLFLAPVLLSLCVLPAAGQAGAPAAPSLEHRLEEAIAALRTHQDTSGVVGLSAAIAADGRLLWTGGFGYADLQNRVPAGPGMVSRIGSISKSVAAVAAMALWDEDRLELDAPIATYLPAYPAENARITLRQLMSHTAGVRHYRDQEFLSNIRYDDVMKPLEVFWADSLLFEPGSAYEYTTYGWTVVSAVTDAGDPDRDWVTILEDEVIEPLGLVTLQPEWQDSIIPGHARFYERTPGGALVNAPEVDLSNKWAGGGLVATTADLVNFGLGVTRGLVLSDEARAEMWRRQTPEQDAPSYGLGWGVGEIDGHRAVSHSGGSVGATAMLLVLPDDGVVVAILGNTGNVGHVAIARRVAALFLD